MQVLPGDWLPTLAMDAVGDGRVPPPSGIGLHDLATPESLREERPSFQQPTHRTYSTSGYGATASRPSFRYPPTKETARRTGGQGSSIPSITVEELSEWGGCPRAVSDRQPEGLRPGRSEPFCTSCGTCCRRAWRASFHARFHTGGNASPRTFRSCNGSNSCSSVCSTAWLDRTAGSPYTEYRTHRQASRGGRPASSVATSPGVRAAWLWWIVTP